MMPTVITIQGDEASDGGCKTVKRKDGCTILLCPTGKLTKNGKRRWQFKKGSMRCPAKAR
jgi:hypothetical protein